MNSPSHRAGFGMYVGTVESAKLDPDGCIAVRIPALGGTFMARVAAPMAGSERGVMFVPEQDDQVVVAAITGSDVKWAVMGSLWSRNEKPPVANPNESNDTKVIKTRSGNTIQLIDKDGDESIQIADKTGKNKLLIQTKTNSVAISALDGSISLDAKSIHIQASEGSVIIKGPKVELNPKS